MTVPATLVDLFLLGGEQGARTAYVYRTGVRRLTFSFEDTIRHAQTVAAMLQERGVKPGDHVMLLGPNGPAWVWSFFGILLAGGVVDIFGDLTGNIIIPEETVAYLERRQRELLIEASNAETGSDSTNAVDVDVTSTDATELTNTADVQNNVTIDAITGQNSATQNTGGSTVATGDVEAVANTVTLANMSVVDGNLGLIIVNALNRWLGFLLGSDGAWTPIGHDYSTVIAAENSSTGADSTNTVDIDVTETHTTEITNEASITNTLGLAAITGQNQADQNTGNASVSTGDALVNATVVNVVNTNVVGGGFFVAVVNVFGNWLGELFFGSQPVGTLASGGTSAGGGLTIQAENSDTGSNSENTIDVDVESTSTVTIENNATIENNLTVNADTGHNTADRNTGLGSVDTGDVLAVLHARNIANIALAGVGSAWGDITSDLTNDTTGAFSTNTIDVTVNDERHVTVLNDAVVDTAIGAFANTGFNTANRNTLGGLVTTGVADVDAFIENLLNQTWLLGAWYGDDPGSADFEFVLANLNTGSGSTNENTVDPNISTEVNLTNDADVQNDATVLATTGNNQASQNTGGGAVGSGTAGVGGGIENTANQTSVSGDVVGSLDLNASNTADIGNTVVALASSGGNEASQNTGSLSLPTTPPPGGLPPSGDDGGGDVSPPPPTGVGGGTVGGGGVLLGQGGEGGEEAPQVVAAQPKAAVKAAQKITVVPGSSAAAGDLGGGPAWVPPLAQASRALFSAPEAQAAAPGAPAGSPALANASARREGPSAARWPWVALAVAGGLLLGSARSFRNLFRGTPG